MMSMSSGSWLALLGCLLGLVSADLITSLPGAPTVSFKQYAGYFQVSNAHYLHYWFTESQSTPSTDPLLLWLTGGPGCSGLSAMLTEIGPFQVNSDATIRSNEWSWNRNANLLVIESPAGVGYSYSTDGDVSTSDEQTAVENRNALKEFFKLFPAYKTNDLYITGESYAGIYVPTLVQTILDNQSDFSMNLKGMLIGNGCVSDSDGTDTAILFQYSHGMIDETTWNRVKTECCSGVLDGCPFHNLDGFGFCSTFVQEALQNVWYSGLNPYNIYADCADVYDMATRPKTRYSHDYFMHTGKFVPINKDLICSDETAVTTYLNRADVRKALFVPTSLPKWEICSTDVSYQYQRLYYEMQSRVQQAVSAGLRVLLYNGDVDMVCNFLMGQRFAQKLGYAETSSKRSFDVNGQIGGFHTQYGKVEFVTVRGSGHMVPTDKPAVAYHMLDAFLNGQSPEKPEEEGDGNSGAHAPIPATETFFCFILLRMLLLMCS